jgi:hypothetical protein
MSQSQARAWWADVEHLHERFEREREAVPRRRFEREREAPPRRRFEPDPDRAPAAAQHRPAAQRRTVKIRGQAIPSVSARRLVEVERRRPPVRAVDRARLRPDRIALWAVVLGLFLIVAAASSSQAATRGGHRYGDRDTYVRVHLGTRTLARGMAGRDVRTLQRLLGVRATGVFGPLTKAAVRRFQGRSGLGVDGAVGPATRSRLIRSRMRVRIATFYGPGLFGRRTACGARLTRRLPGVAHRRLPCGTPVTFLYAGRFVTTRVVDRGPFVRGITFDLTSATARALGMSSTARLRAAY